jgi:hypothetical protein
MPLNGSGTYTPPTPEYPAIPNTTILASDFNTILEDLATALSTAVYKDGQAPMSANLNMASHKLTSLSDGALDADSVNFAQVFKNPTFTGSVGTGVVITGTKATITAAVLDLTVPDTNITGSTTLDLVSPAITLTSSGTIADVATTTATINAGTSITFTAPTITNVGTTIVDIGTTSTCVTQLASDSSTKLASTAFVQSVAFQSTLPTLVGNNGKLLTITAGVVNWGNLINVTVNSFADGTDTTKRAHLILSGITAGQDRALTVRDEAITLVGSTTTDALKLYDYTDATKIAKVQLSGITAGNTRVLTLADNDIIVDTPGGRLLSVVTISNQATVDIETTFDTTYDKYVIEIDGLTVADNTANLYARFKLGGSYLSTGIYSYDGVQSNAFVTPQTAQTQIVLATNLSNAAQASANFTMKTSDPAGSFYKSINVIGSITNSSNIPVSFSSCGGSTSTAALTGIRLLMSAGNLLAGSIKVYGLRKSI